MIFTLVNSYDFRVAQYLKCVFSYWSHIASDQQRSLKGSNLRSTRDKWILKELSSSIINIIVLLLLEYLHQGPYTKMRHILFPCHSPISYFKHVRICMITLSEQLNKKLASRFSCANLMEYHSSHQALHKMPICRSDRQSMSFYYNAKHQLLRDIREVQPIHSFG